MFSNQQHLSLTGNSLNTQFKHPLSHLNQAHAVTDFSGLAAAAHTSHALNAVYTAAPATRSSNLSSKGSHTASAQSANLSTADSLLGDTTQSITGSFPNETTLLAHSKQNTTPTQGTPYSRNEENFLRRSAQGSALELSTAELALQKAQTPQVQQYAQTLITDHAQYNLRLMPLGQQSNSVLPVELNQQSRSELHRLNRYSGSAFDRQFVQEEANANAEDVADATRQVRISTNPSVRAFASDFLPVQQRHLQTAESLGGVPKNS